MDDREMPATKKRERVSLTDTSIERIARSHPLVPTREETAGMAGGGVVGLLFVWLLQAKGVTVPPEVGAAIGTIAAQVVHYLTSFLPRRR